MVHIALFHSVLGLRSVELLAAERLRRAGHEVVTPDLFGGESAATLHEGLQLLDRVGWAAVVERARQTLRGMPEKTVFVGVSMGAGVIAALWPERPATAGVLLLHAAADVPASARPGLRVQLHAAEPDDFAPPERVAALCQAARERGVDLKVFRYPGAGHFYTDRELPDHDPAAAELTWRRVLHFLDRGSASRMIGSHPFHAVLDADGSSKTAPWLYG
ncbi:dienelactone hydrolase family protein [Streptomyces sp. NPDC004014]